MNLLKTWGRGRPLRGCPRARMRMRAHAYGKAAGSVERKLGAAETRGLARRRRGYGVAWRPPPGRRFAAADRERGRGRKRGRRKGSPFSWNAGNPLAPPPAFLQRGRRRNGSEMDRGRIPTRRPRGRALGRGRLPRGAGAVRPRPRWSRRHCPPGGRWPSGGGGPSPSSPRHPGSSGFRR